MVSTNPIAGSRRKWNAARMEPLSQARGSRHFRCRREPDFCYLFVYILPPRQDSPFAFEFDLISGGSVELAMDGEGRSCPTPFPAFRTAGNQPPARRSFAL